MDPIITTPPEKQTMADAEIQIFLQLVVEAFEGIRADLRPSALATIISNVIARHTSKPHESLDELIPFLHTEIDRAVEANVQSA